MDALCAEIELQSSAEIEVIAMPRKPRYTPCQGSEISIKAHQPSNTAKETEHFAYVRGKPNDQNAVQAKLASVYNPKTLPAWVSPGTVAMQPIRQSGREGGRNEDFSA